MNLDSESSQKLCKSTRNFSRFDWWWATGACGLDGYQSERVYFSKQKFLLVAREMKLRFMRLGVVCEALTDLGRFCLTTSIIDEILVFPLRTTPSIIDSLLDAQDMGAKTVPLQVLPIRKPKFTETILVWARTRLLISNESAQIPMLIIIDLLYAYFLEIDHESKEKNL